MPARRLQAFVTDLDGTVLIDEKQAAAAHARLKQALRALEARGT